MHIYQRLKNQYKKLFKIKKQALILMYHRVIDLENDPQLLCVSPVNFKEHILYLKEKYNLIPASKAIEDLRNNCLGNKSVAITFDDGYFDNYTYALPILERLKAPASVFISNCNINSKRELFWDKLEQIFFKKDSLPANINLSIADINYKADLTNNNDIKKAYNDICAIIRPLSVALRKAVISYLIKWSGILPKNRNTHRLLSLDELKQLSASEFIKIGGHTVNHVTLSSLSKEEQYREIKNNIIFLEKQTGEKLKSFSYPFGSASDYNLTTIKALKSLGFDHAFSTIQKNVTPESEPFSIPRRVARNWSIGEFKKKIDLFFRCE